MVYDLIIVGTGPAGLSAAAHAQKEGLSVLLLEQGRLANTIFNYQKRKHVMAEPAIIPLRSDLAFEAGSREAILEAWEAAVKDSQIQLHQAETVHEITKNGRFFEVRSDKSSYEAVHVILAIGIQGNPNRLGKPGEYLSHVSYHLLDPFIYENEDIMMVGSGEAAIEGVLALCDKNRVTVINREREFFRLKHALDKQITDKLKTKQIVAYHNATVERFEPGYAKINLPDEVITVKTDRVFVRIGASLPRPFLEKCGVTFESEQPNALPLLSERYEATVPGLYVIGAAAGCGLIKEGLNQGYEVVE
jgi:thioredoxin reductase